MASDTGSAYPTFPPKPQLQVPTAAMNAHEVVAYVRKELDINEEHLARVISSNNGELPHDAHSGVTLDLSHKNIHELPVEVVALIKDRVERLALSHNPSIALPHEIVQCDRLRYLNLRWNGLRQFPEVLLQLSKLEILDISKNKIVAIPEDIKRMSSLKFLAVARNKITRLPLAIGEMATLSKFKFDENPIEFPPPDVLRPQTARDGASQGMEQEKDVCQQVKRFLRQASLRERLMSHSEDDVRYAGSTTMQERRLLTKPSESNMETPRAPRRTLGGRFPVRPSISGIEGVADLKSESPNENAPPIPARSHARVASQNLGFQLKRPGIAPLLTGTEDASRSRSETLSSSASLRARRQGFVPSKRVISNQTPDTNISNDAASQGSSRSSQATIRAPHSRNASIASTYQGLLAANSGGETSSGAVSPVDGPVNRYASAQQRVGNSLMQHPNIKLLKSRPIIAARRLLFVLLELHRPLTRIAVGLKEGTPKRSMLERHLFSASTQVEEIDRLLNKLDAGYEDTPKREAAVNRNIAIACDNALKSFSMVVKEMKGYMMKIVHVLDPLLVRSLMFQIYTTMSEARNICKMLGFALAPPSSSPATVNSPRRSSRAWSSRTVTPTQPKPPTNRRLRGPTVLRSISSNSTLRAMPPPVPLNGNTTRTNTMTSTTAATPRSGESFTSGYSSAVPSRSNTIRSHHTTEDSDDGDQFERIFLKLRQACDLAGQALPKCHAEFTVHKDNAETAGKHRESHCWSLALSKCNGVIRANRELQARLKQVRLKDPGVRNQKDFWQLCDAFVQVSRSPYPIQNHVFQTANVPDLGRARHRSQRHRPTTHRHHHHQTCHETRPTRRQGRQQNHFRLAALPPGLTRRRSRQRSKQQLLPSPILGPHVARTKPRAALPSRLEHLARAESAAQSRQLWSPDFSAGDAACGCAGTGGAGDVGAVRGVFSFGADSGAWTWIWVWAGRWRLGTAVAAAWRVHDC